ncbi:hypothetical protein ACFZCK_20280 [Kitasatospora purpeofusca]|uniref:hypothetical protein n=1 Tax=Kitasatospora purpeofusca TaxID=67352 RepID=UPI0036EF4B31
MTGAGPGGEAGPGPGAGGSDPVAALLAPYRDVPADPGTAAPAAALLAEAVAAEDCRPTG